MDRRGDRLAQSGRELALVSGEVALLGDLDENQHPYRLTVEDQRHAQAGHLAPPLHAPTRVRVKTGVGDGLLDGHPTGQDRATCGILRQREELGRGEVVLRVSTVVGALHEAFALGDVLPDEALRGAERQRGLLRDLGEHVVKDHGRSDGGAGVDQRSEPPVALLEVAQELRVIDRRGGQLGEAGDEGQLLGAEMPVSLALVDLEDALGDATHAQRHAEAHLVAPSLQSLAAREGKVRIGEPLLKQLAALEDVPLSGVVVQWQGFSPAVPARRRRLVHRPRYDRVARGIVFEDHALRSAKRFGGEQGYHTKRLFEPRRGGHRPAGVQQRSQPGVTASVRLRGRPPPGATRS